MRKRRRRLDLLEEFIVSFLTKYIGSFWSRILAKAINKYAKEFALKLATLLGWKEDDLIYEDEFELFI